MTALHSTLFAAPATVKAIAEARAVVFMVGSYDGSGNFGDIAQFRAALSLVERLGPGLLPVPVLERSVVAYHRALVEAGEPAPASPVFFDPAGACEDDLLPVAAPADLAFGASYLYGGGYLNASWGDRKLAMLRSAEALLAAGGAPAPCRVASGLQAEAAWIAGLAEADTALLRSFEVLGVRDAGSAPALEALGAAAPVVPSADDAVAVLRELAPAAPPVGDGPLRVNLHFAEHEWVTDRPADALGFYTGFLDELRRSSGRPLTLQPLIAYLDGRIDERAAAERLRGACASIAEIENPVVLRPAGLAAAAPRLGGAHLTLSSSYHVALTSLMLAVPALLLGDNPYYEQKAAGLVADFGLPAAFAPTAKADASAVAREVAEAVLDARRAAELRRKLEAGGERLLRLRALTEQELLGRLGAGAIAALDRRIEALSERLRLHAAEPAELHARIGALLTERDELLRIAESPLESELRAQEAEAQLAALIGSRSWRLTAPLRRLGGLRRRR